MATKSRCFFFSLTSVSTVILFTIGLITFSNCTVCGAKAFVDFDCWKLRNIFLCLDGLSVNAFSVLVSSATDEAAPSGLTAEGAWIMIDLCLFEFDVVFVCGLFV